MDSRVDGTFNAEVDDDRTRCRPGILAKGVDRPGVGRSKSTDAMVYHGGKLEGYALRHTKPVQAVE